MRNSNIVVSFVICLNKICKSVLKLESSNFNGKWKPNRIVITIIWCMHNEMSYPYSNIFVLFFFFFSLSIYLGQLERKKKLQRSLWRKCNAKITATVQYITLECKLVIYLIVFLCYILNFCCHSIESGRTQQDPFV